MDNEYGLGSISTAIQDPLRIIVCGGVRTPSFSVLKSPCSMPHPKKEVVLNEAWPTWIDPRDWIRKD